MIHELFLDDEQIRMSRLVSILEDWAKWQRGYSIMKQPSHSVGLCSGYASSKTFDDLVEAADARVCEIVETLIDDLPPGPRAAINVRYGIAAVFRFPRGNYEELLLQGHESLMLSLPKKGVAI